MREEKAGKEKSAYQGRSRSSLLQKRLRDETSTSHHHTSLSHSSGSFLFAYDTQRVEAALHSFLCSSNLIELLIVWHKVFQVELLAAAHAVSRDVTIVIISSSIDFSVHC